MSRTDEQLQSQQRQKQPESQQKQPQQQQAHQSAPTSSDCGGVERRDKKGRREKAEEEEEVEEDKSLIERNHDSLIRPEEEEAKSTAMSNLQPPTPVTMSPRIPRKRIAANNYAKEDDFENEFELQSSDTKPLTGPASPAALIVSPNSLSSRSFAPNDIDMMIGSPIHSSSGGAGRNQPNANWTNTIDIENDDDRNHRINESNAKLRKSSSSNDRQNNDDAEEDEDEDAVDKKYHPNGGAVDVSLYTTKKNVAQGMLDIALLSANCSQLKYLLYHYERDTSLMSSNRNNVGSGGSTFINWFNSLDFYFVINLVCIAISIALQVIVGILLILNGRHNIYVYRYQRVADSYSNAILITVFVITIVNIFLSVFISAR